MDESRRRADEWLDLVADLLAGPPAAWPHQAVLQLLVDTFDAAGGCHYVRYGHEPPVQRQFPGDMFAAHHDEHVALCQDEAANPHPVLRFYLITGYRQPCQVADVPDRIADRRTMDTWYGLHRSWDSVVPHQLAFPLRLDARANRSLLVGREEPFTPQDTAWAGRLQRLLVGLDRHLAALAGWSRRSEPRAVDAARSVCLTARELVILDLLAQGLTAATIARRLGVAERTVQKHLQRCYAKLDAPDRLTAVLRAQSIGLLPSPADVRTSRPVMGDATSI